MKLIGDIINAIAAPFRAGIDFVDRHPSIGSVREHLQAQDVKVIQDGQTVRVELSVKHAHLADPMVLSEVKTDADLTLALAYANGFASGWGKSADQVINLRRSDICNQAKSVLASARAEAIFQDMDEVAGRVQPA